MSRHPIIGQEYEVVDHDTPVFQAEEVVPIGEDEYGNLRVDQYGGGTTKTVLWNERAFQMAVDEGGLVEA